MSHFPSPENFSLNQSIQHLSHLPKINKPFVLKKAKQVYLYDLDGNKYTDFSLGHGTIITHSPPRLTKFIKNALSSGMNTMGFYSKFMLKSQKNWRDIFQTSEISFYSSFIEMLLVVIRQYSIKKIAYTSDFLLTLVTPLETLIEFQKINSFSENIESDLILFEEYNDNFEFLKPSNLLIPSIKIHSRFAYRRENFFDFTENCMHYLGTLPFGGKEIGVLATDEKLLYSPPAFDNGILFLEGSKLYSKKINYPLFKHSKFTTKLGFAFAHESLDQEFFLKRGIYFEDNVLYFSPYHTIHDINRLQKVLKEYFSKV